VHWSAIFLESSRELVTVYVLGGLAKCRDAESCFLPFVTSTLEWSQYKREVRKIMPVDQNSGIQLFEKLLVGRIIPPVEMQIKFVCLFNYIICLMKKSAVNYLLTVSFI
jgi:hypothetical protein